MRFKPGIALLMFLFISGSNGYTQPQPVSKGYNAVLSNTGQFGLTFGPAIYHGDLNIGNFTFKRSTGLAASLFGQYYFSEVFGFRISLFTGILNGGIRTWEKSGAVVEDSFTGIILEGDLHMVINFSNLFFGQRPARKFFVYGILGMGYGGWYSKLTNKVYNYDSLAIDNPLSNFNVAFVIPAGLGCYYRIGNRLNLGLEYSYKTYFSDKLDNAVAGYPYDVVNYVALNISFNLGTGMAKGRSGKPPKSMQMQPAEYPVSYPVYTPAYSPAYSPPPDIPRAEPAKSQANPAKSRAEPVISRETISYAVQIFAFSHHKYTVAYLRKKYQISEVIRLEKDGDVERFIVGRCLNQQCAIDIKEIMNKKGIHDAFIVVYKNGKRQYTIK